MYTRGQVEGILIFTARPTFKIVNSKKHKLGWVPRYHIAIRVTEKFIEPIRQSLSYLDIHSRREREKSRHVDTIFITRRDSISKVIEMISINATNRSDNWEKFVKLMSLIEEKIHLEEDGRYSFEVILNEEQDKQTENIYW